MLDPMFHLPSLKKSGRFLITPEVVRGEKDLLRDCFTETAAPPKVHKPEKGQFGGVRGAAARRPPIRLPPDPILRTLDSRPMFARWRTMLRTAATAASAVRNLPAPNGSRRGAARRQSSAAAATIEPDRDVARERHHRRPHAHRDQEPEREDGEEHAAARRHALAAFEFQKDRPVVPGDGGEAGQRDSERNRRLADAAAVQQESGERRQEPLQHVQREDEDSPLAAERAADVRRAHVAAADLANVYPAHGLRDEIRERHRAEQIGAENERNVPSLNHRIGLPQSSE